jgi:hypothetical protein
LPQSCWWNISASNAPIINRPKMDRNLFTRTISLGNRRRNYQSTLQSQEISPVKTRGSYRWLRGVERRHRDRAADDGRILSGQAVCESCG